MSARHSSASGNYGVVVPAGTFDVSFTPGGGACALPVLHSNVVVGGATTRNATLPASSSATAAAFAGDGHNLDVLTPVPVVIGGPTLAVLGGAHNGTLGGIAPRAIPASSALLGQTWACQYTVTGVGFVDLSRAAFGVVGCP